MEKASLDRLLRRGLSYAEIGRRFDRDPSTVSYWARRHGLTSVYAEVHSPKGGVDRSRLEELVASGASVAAIAQALQTSESSVKYWLRKWALRTSRSARMEASRAARGAGRAEIVRECGRHGRVGFVIEGRGSYRCARCRSDAVMRRRRKAKAILVREAGGVCVRCGYSRCLDALQLHHRDPRLKSFSISEGGLTRALSLLRAEAAKCDLLCANCHAEVEAGMVSIAVEGQPDFGGEVGRFSESRERSGVAQSGRAIGC